MVGELPNFQVRGTSLMLSVQGEVMGSVVNMLG